MGASGLIGGLCAGTIMKRTGPGFMVGLGLAICVPAGLAMAIPETAAVLAAAMALGLSLPLVIVGSMTALQLYTPNELMGRVSGVDNLIVTGLQVVGIGVGAALIGAVFYRDLCYFTAATMAVCSLYIFTRRAQRKANLPRPLPTAETLPQTAQDGAAALDTSSTAAPSWNVQPATGPTES